MPTALVLKLVFGVDLTLSALVFASWVFLGFLVTFDEFFPGGWSNIDGAHPVPYGELALRGLLFVVALNIWLELSQNC
ncbi:MAG: hypothetical protein AAFR65_15235 [Pseudomonadota bacterium]